MIYYTYKIINNINGNYYIGCRSYRGDNINEDTYLGSGKLIKRAVKKYGKENFTKIILNVYENKLDMYEDEYNIITKDILLDEACYNLAEGGWGGYTYYDDRKFNHTEDTKAKISKANKGRARNDVVERNRSTGFNTFWKDRSRTEEDRSAKRLATLKSLNENRHPSQIKKICPHCSKECSIANAKRWHFNNCKLLKGV